MTIDPTPVPAQTYQTRKATYSAEYTTARNKSSRLSNIRLAVFLIAMIGFFWFVFKSDLIPALLFMGIGGVIFTILVIKHGKILIQEKLAARLRDINGAGLQRLASQWNKFAENGNEYVEDAHPYSSDLDLFGPSSLYQHINTAHTHLGRQTLRRLLIDKPRTCAEIITDQGMIKELATRVDWRQYFQTTGGRKENPESLFLWAEDKAEIFPRPRFTLAIRFLPILSIAFALFSFFKLGSLALMVPPFLLQMFIMAQNQRKHGIILETLSRQRDNLITYLEMFRHIESAHFQNPDLQALVKNFGKIKTSKGSLGTISTLSSSSIISQLQNMTDSIETRLNPLLHVPLNILFLWDIQWLWAFRRWRNENGGRLRPWLEMVGQLESLASLAIISFENPSWVFPEIIEGEPLLEAKAMAHPLLPADTRVANDFSLQRRGEIVIITGSNMSGKSTLMRTVGINLVLAFAGAPVCAEGFKCSVVELHTSMRLRDDLEKRISSFYAELLRIKGIVEAARSGKKVLFLVDEIFRGTNSKDRHEGAMSVLRQLHDLSAAGLVSTHDLELARLEEIEPEFFRNQHFQESYVNGKIIFNFKIEPGISKTTNAIHLLKMVGLG
jgi:DNA mismatch repair ATPase MutS